MTQPILQTKKLSKYFPIPGGFFGAVKAQVQAVHEISLEVGEGEILGLVGESGCGKSTLGRTILKLLEPSSGQIFFNGEDITNQTPAQMRPRRKEMQIVFQDPYASLNPRMTIGSAILEPIKVHNTVPKAQRQDRVAELLDMVGLSLRDYPKYPHEFSGGQRQRIGIARALALNPRLVIADEPVSALDVSIQAQIINLLSDLQIKLGLSMIFIAHDLKVVEHICNRIVVMYLGRIMEVLPAKAINQAQHPYTKSLLSAVPIPDPKAKRARIILQGDVPSPINPPTGCVFHTRCPIAQKICSEEIPALRDIAPNQQAACHLI